MSEDAQILAGAKELLETEARALGQMGELLDGTFVEAVRMVTSCEGRLLTTGIGKAGIIARKISATLASTGTPSDYLQPAEAIHGDLGRVTRSDVVLALSNSGSTEEILRLLGPLRSIGAKILAITGNGDSALAGQADISLVYGRVTEACPLGLAPTTSTTVMLALGDALAMEVLKARDFSPKEFARFHPGGNLGRSLMRVHEVMRQGRSLPLVASGTSLAEAVEVMTSTPGRPGAVIVTTKGVQFAGFYTDGDLRRNFLSARGNGSFELFSRPIDEFMTHEPITIGPDELVGDALRILRERKIDQLAVVDEQGSAVGLLDIQDLLDIKALSWGPLT
ncbi:MAG: arabinose-5-phosphate isomerase [Pseudohongiellaceae bacterium]